MKHELDLILEQGPGGDDGVGHALLPVHKDELADYAEALDFGFVADDDI